MSLVRLMIITKIIVHRLGSKTKEGMKPSFSIPKNDLKKCNEAHSHNRGSALDHIEGVDLWDFETGFYLVAMFI